MAGVCFPNRFITIICLAATHIPAILSSLAKSANDLGEYFSITLIVPLFTLLPYLK